MKYIFISILFIGCTNNTGVAGTKEFDKTPNYGSGGSIVEINGCQYAIFQGRNSGDFAMVHAGDCPNQIHNK